MTNSLSGIVLLNPASDGHAIDDHLVPFEFSLIEIIRQRRWGSTVVMALQGPGSCGC